MGMIIKDTSSEIVLKSTIPTKLSNRIAAIVIVLLFVCLFVMFLSGTDWESFDSLFDVMGCMFGGGVVALMMLGLAATLWYWSISSDTSVRIQFNQPPGFMTVTKEARFQKQTTQIPLDEVRRIYSDTDYVLIQTGPLSATTKTAYQVRVPTGTGESLTLYNGFDPETARLIERRITEAIGVSNQHG